jgi:hypothetical protein
MNLKKPFTFKYIIFATVLLVGTFLSISGDFIDSNTLFKIPNASADAHLGIQGQLAPELNLSTWIDGNGKTHQNVPTSLLMEYSFCWELKLSASQSRS